MALKGAQSSVGYYHPVVRVSYASANSVEQSKLDADACGGDEEKAVLVRQIAAARERAALVG
eukprot:629598-Pleurochrysis_carterae.AAC.1